jgi:hypothetical protein
MAAGIHAAAFITSPTVARAAPICTASSPFAATHDHIFTIAVSAAVAVGAVSTAITVLGEYMFLSAITCFLTVNTVVSPARFGCHPLEFVRVSRSTTRTVITRITITTTTTAAATATTAAAAADVHSICFTCCCSTGCAISLHFRCISCSSPSSITSYI